MLASMDASPTAAGLDWDEEPLFADDINSDDDEEDPPPLPPPMPPLSQLTQPHDRGAPRTVMGGVRGGGDWDAAQNGTAAGKCPLNKDAF